MPRWVQGVRHLVGVGLVAYLSLEAVMYVAACAGFRAYGVQAPAGVREGPLLSGSTAAYDRIAGGRWQPGKAQFVRVSGGNLVYDVDVAFNNRGYPTRLDFAPRKSPDRLRLAVLGDSFTAGLYLERPWPDRLDEELRRAGARPRVEVYNFAVDGSGLANWHSIFFGEIVPGFEFDALVIARWGDDLRRDFIAYHGREDGVYFTYLPDDRRPADAAELVAAHGDRMGKLISTVDGETIAEIRRELRPWRLLPPDFYFVKFARAQWRLAAHAREERRWRGSALLPATPDHPSRDEIEAYLRSTLGDARARKLVEILDHCRRRNVPVILATVPSRPAIAIRKAGGPIPEDRQELARIAAAFGTHFFDGYEAFVEVPAERLPDHFLPGDDHWNQQGSDRFARAFAAWLREEWLPRSVGRSDDSRKRGPEPCGTYSRRVRSIP